MSKYSMGNSEEKFEDNSKSNPNEISFGASSPEELEERIKHNEELAEEVFHIQEPIIIPNIDEENRLNSGPMIPDSPLETDNVWKQRYFSLLSAYNMMADTLRKTQ